MISSNGRRHDATAAPIGAALDSPELRRLAAARSALEHAQRQAKWKRKCKNLQSAAHAVQEAALAAHSAGIGWTQIGDVLGIERAMTPSSTHLVPTPIPETRLGHHRSEEVVAASDDLADEPEWVARITA